MHKARGCYVLLENESSTFTGEFDYDEEFSEYNLETFEYCNQEIKRLIELWVEFNTLIPEHDKLMELWKKKNSSKKNKKSLRPKTKCFLKEEFPHINFLRVKSLSQAMNYIYDLSPYEMRDLIKLIEKEKEDGIFYHSMVEWIRSSRFTIIHCDMPDKYIHDKEKYQASVDENEKRLQEETGHFAKIRKMFSCSGSTCNN